MVAGGASKRRLQFVQGPQVDCPIVNTGHPWFKDLCRLGHPPRGSARQRSSDQVSSPWRCCADATVGGWRDRRFRGATHRDTAQGAPECQCS